MSVIKPGLVPTDFPGIFPMLWKSMGYIICLVTGFVQVQFYLIYSTFTTASIGGPKCFTEWLTLSTYLPLCSVVEGLEQLEGK